MKILITGGTGFIGSNLVESLLQENHELFITGTKTENKIPDKVKFFHLSTSDLTKYLDVDVVFHQAANNDTLDYDNNEMLRVNYYDPMELFQNLWKKGCKKFVYASSTAVYGDSKPPYIENSLMEKPLNIYAESKLLFDEFAMNFAKSNNISVVGLRYCNIYGINEFHKGHRASMIYQIYQKLKYSKNIKLFKYGEQLRDYCYVKDVVKANLKALDFDNSGIFNIANGKSTSFNELVNVISNKMKVKPNIDWIDCPFQDKYQNFIECDINKAIKQLKWQPDYNIQTGVEDYIDLLEKKN